MSQIFIYCMKRYETYKATVKEVTCMFKYREQYRL